MQCNMYAVHYPIEFFSSSMHHSAATLVTNQEPPLDGASILRLFVLGGSARPQVEQ
jgi:hypothetical protein